MRNLFRSKRLAGAGADASECDDPRPFVLQMLGWSSRDAVAFVVGVLASVAILANALFLQSGPHPAPMLKTGLIPIAPPPAPQATVGALPAPRPGAGTPVPAKSAQARPEPQAAPGAAQAPRASAAIIADIQRELARRGFLAEPADGRLGPKTEAAVRNFERAAGLKASTEPNEALLRAITRSTAKGTKPAGTKSSPLASRPPASIPGSPVVAAPAAASVPSPPPSPVREATADSNVPTKRVLAVQRALADFGYGQIKPTGIVDGPTEAAIQKFERERKLPVTGRVSDRIAQELAAITGRAVE